MCYFIDLLQGLDDMESDLFGGSLGNKATPSKSSKPSKAAASDSKEKLKTDKNPPASGDLAVKSANSNKTQPTPSSSANGKIDDLWISCKLEWPNLITFKKKILELGAEIPV